MLRKVQQHTIEIYSLQGKEYCVKKIKARALLTPDRFDLFAKLYYIRNKNKDEVLARNVYIDHIKAFNPDGKEPGRDDKVSLGDFVTVFDSLISEFENSEFNENISLIPVDANGVILDGAHRVAILAYYDKDVTTIQFKNTYAKCSFNYEYFKNRGMSWTNMDIVASEMVKWKTDTLVACIWPKVGSKVQIALSHLSKYYKISYIHNEKIKFNSFKNFIRAVYCAQSWTRNPESVCDKAANCYKFGQNMSIVFFEVGNEAETVLEQKEKIREIYGCGKHSLHITDNHSETVEISKLIFTVCGRKSWIENSALNFFGATIRAGKERLYYFRKVYWINLKVFVAKFIYK